MREVRLAFPVDEGERYKIGKLDISGQHVDSGRITPAVLQGPGRRHLQQEEILKGYDKAKEVYGAGGFMEFTMLPEFSFRGIDPETGKPIGPTPPSADRRHHAADERRQAVLRQSHHVHRQHHHA